MFDFGVGYSEMFVLALIAIIVIGPKDLPKVLRTFGRFMSKARGLAHEFQGHVDKAMREAGVDDLKKDMQSLKGLAAPSLDAVGSATRAKTADGVVDMKALEPPKPAEASPFAAGEGETRIAGQKVDPA